MSDWAALRWARTGTGAGLAKSGGLLAELRIRHAEAHRAYHTFTHLEEAFGLLDSQPLPFPVEVELALWYHDAIYDPTATDNERQSAALAVAHLGALGVEAARLDRIATLIEATAHHVAPSGDQDAALLLDVDLGILGAAPDRFDTYDAQIRREYAFVPEDVYRQARAAILAGMLHRPRLFVTEALHGRLDAQARLNLARAIERLDHGV